MADRLRARGVRGVWDIVLLLAFIPGAAWWVFIVLIKPTGLGVHGDIYADAAAAWLHGANPWLVGPEDAVFAGPPTMLLPFLPFAFLPSDVNRLAWVVVDVVVAAWVLRKLRLPAYWIAFPPLFSAIVLGHIEVLILGAIVVGGPLSGLAAVIKPYAALPLVADRRWKALAVAVVVVVATLPFLPWAQFLAESQSIAANLARQDTGDSTFGQVIPMLIGTIALLSLGPKRALWLAVPVLWPYAQAIYKTMTIPMLTPIVAVFWALPFEGSTLIGIVAFAALVQVQRMRPLPAFLRAGIEPISTLVAPPSSSQHLPQGSLVPA